MVNADRIGGEEPIAKGIEMREEDWGERCIYLSIYLSTLSHTSDQLGCLALPAPTPQDLIQ
jgi:hypothetical protein